MAWKMDKDGNIVLENNNPVWTDEATGKEIAVDYAATQSKLADTTRETMQRKDRIRELEASLKPFEGIENLSEWVAEAKSAIEMKENAPDKDKELEERLQSRLASATEPLKKKLSEKEQALNNLQAQFKQEAIGNAFGQSKYVQEKLVNPALAKDLFAKNFTVKDGQIVAQDEKGEPIYGAEGIASFDEALAKLTNDSPYKDHLMKGSNASGSGAGSGGGAGTINRSQLKTTADKSKFISEHGMEAYKNLTAE